MTARGAAIFVPESARRPAHHRHRCLAWCRRKGWGVVAITHDPRYALQLVHEGGAQHIVVARREHLKPLVAPAVVATGMTLPATALVVARSGAGVWWWVRRGGVTAAVAGGLALIPVVGDDPPVQAPERPPAAAPTLTPELEPTPTPVPQPEPPAEQPVITSPVPQPTAEIEPTPTPERQPEPEPEPEPESTPTPAPSPADDDLCVLLKLLLDVEVCPGG